MQTMNDASTPGWLSRSTRWTAALAITGGLMIGLVGGTPATAASWQTGATPTTGAAADCVPPPQAHVPVAAPVAATAVASPAATPATVPSDGPPADAATVKNIEQLVRAFAACETDADYQTVAQLVTEDYLGATYAGGGTLSRADYLDLATQLPAIPQKIVSVGDVRLTKGGASADIVAIVGNELIHARWAFVLTDETAIAAATPIGDFTGIPGSHWLIDATEPLPVSPPADAAKIRATIKEYEIHLTPRSVSSSSVVLTGKNTGKEAHEMLVVRMGPGTKTDDLLRQPGPGLPKGITFAGQVTIPAGTTGQLVLVDLQSGYYAVVCLLPTKDGTPHLALGERNRFEVTGV
jgi:hypothetical protein